MPDRFSRSAQGDFAHAMEGNVCNGRETGFIAECLQGELPMTALCERYGISRDTGYRLLGRYRAEGPSGLEPRSRAPRRHGMAMAEEVAAAIVALRRQRPYWGPKKLRAVLQTVVAGAVDDWRSAAARGAQRATPPAAASGAA